MSGHLEGTAPLTLPSPQGGEGISVTLSQEGRGQGEGWIQRERLETGFEEARGALTAADAHGHDAVARLAPQHLVGDGADHARAGHAEGVTDRDRAPVGI